MSDTECPHGLDTRWCSVCLRGVTKPDPSPTVDCTFRARFDGECRTCDLPISAGLMVCRLSNGAYVHLGCQP